MNVVFVATVVIFCDCFVTGVIVSAAILCWLAGLLCVLWLRWLLLVVEIIVTVSHISVCFVDFC
jgi:hypothetical protein